MLLCVHLQMCMNVFVYTVCMYVPITLRCCIVVGPVKCTSGLVAISISYVKYLCKTFDYGFEFNY